MAFSAWGTTSPLLVPDAGGGFTSFSLGDVGGFPLIRGTGFQ